jgi:outer membrane assembly lipoprotein YfiO
MVTVTSSHSKKLFFALAILLLLTGCSGSSTDKKTDADKPEKELTTKNKINQFLEEKQDGELIKKAKWYVGAALPSTAEEAFDALLTSFPDSAYTEFAQLKTADGYYSTGAYLSAAKAYADFIAQHPNDRNAPYAYIRQGRSYYKSYRGTGRDLSPLEQAQTCLSTFINKYPHTVYLSEAKVLLAQTNERILQHHEAIAAFYEKRSLYGAAKQHRENMPKPPVIQDLVAAPMLSPEYSNP